MSTDERQILAVIIGFENLALGCKGDECFDVGRVLARLIEKGDIVVKRAHADWKRFADNRRRVLHQAACELIEIAGRGLSGENSADIRLCVDAMDLSHAKPHTTPSSSGDGDFSLLDHGPVSPGGAVGAAADSDRCERTSRDDSRRASHPSWAAPDSLPGRPVPPARGVHRSRP